MSRNEWRYFLLACAIKLTVSMLVHPGHLGGNPADAGVLAVHGGDTFSYLDPVENLLAHGVYAQDIARIETYAGRMPGYGVVYGALRLVTGPGPAADGVVALQLLLSLLSIYCLARFAERLTKQPRAFKLTALLYAANTFCTVFDLRLLTESFATSMLIISVYFLCRAQRQASAGGLLSVGAGLAWLVFLRPFLAPLAGVMVGLFLVNDYIRGRRQQVPGRHYLVGLLCLALPFLIADGTWMARNWRWYKSLVPLQTNTWAGYKLAPAQQEAYGFIGAIGEEPVWWHAPSDIAWFYKPVADSSSNFRDAADKLAPPAYTYDSLRRVRRHLAAAQDSTLPLATRQVAEAQAAGALRNYTRAYYRLRPFRAYVLVPFKLAYRLALAHPGDYLFPQPFPQLGAPQKALKIMVHLWYLLVVGLGLLGLLFCGWRFRFENLLLKATPVYLLVLFCAVLHLVEARYFAVAYPFVVVSAVQLLLFLQQRLQKIVVGRSVSVTPAPRWRR